MIPRLPIIRIALLAALAGALIFGYLAWRDHQRDIGAATERAAWQERDRQAAEIAAKETQRRLARQEDSNRETATRLAAAADAVRLERASSGRLRDELDAATAARRSADPAAVAQCAPAEAAVDLRADLFGRADAVAGELAAYADAARIAGAQCEREADALSP